MLKNIGISCLGKAPRCGFALEVAFRVGDVFEEDEAEDGVFVTAASRFARSRSAAVQSFRSRSSRNCWELSVDMKEKADSPITQCMLGEGQKGQHCQRIFGMGGEGQMGSVDI
jgi:hypothetical protein